MQGFRLHPGHKPGYGVFAVFLGRVITYLCEYQKSEPGACKPASTPLEPGNGRAQPSFDFALPLGAEDFASVAFAHIKAVDRGAFLGADFRHGNVQIQLGQRLRNGVQQTNVVFGLDVNHRARVGRLVVEADDRGDAFASERLIERLRDALPGDERGQINFAGQRLVQELFEPVALVLAGEQTGFRVDDIKGVENDAVVAAENLRVENVQPCGGE